MTIQLGRLEPVARLVGVPFPEADEDALWRCARAWYTAADQLRQLPPVASEIGEGVAGALRGIAAERFAEVWSPVGAPDGLLYRLADMCDVIGGACERAAERVEQAKLTILAQLTGLVAGAAGFGVAVPGLAVARGLAVAQLIATVRLVARAEIVRLAQDLGRPIAVPADLDDLLGRVSDSLDLDDQRSGAHADHAPDGWASPMRRFGADPPDLGRRMTLIEMAGQLAAGLPGGSADGPPETVLAASGVDGHPSGEPHRPPGQPAGAPVPAAPTPPVPASSAPLPAPPAASPPAPPAASPPPPVSPSPTSSAPRIPRPGAGPTPPPGAGPGSAPGAGPPQAWPPSPGSPPSAGPPSVGSPPAGPPSTPAAGVPTGGIGAAPGPHPPGLMTAVLGVAGGASPAVPTRTGTPSRPPAGPTGRDPGDPTEPRPVPDDEALALARACLFATDAGYGFYPPGDANRALARAVVPVAGRVAIDLVGDPDGFTINSGRLTPHQFAAVLRELIGAGEITVRDGECLWLVTRGPGERATTPPAATVARQVGIDVVGPDGSVFPAADPDGAESAGDDPPAPRAAADPTGSPGSARFTS